MNRLLTGIMGMLLSAPLLAAMAQEEGGGPPSETVDMIWVIMFAILFFGMIAYFFWYLWYNEKKRTPEK